MQVIWATSPYGLEDHTKVLRRNHVFGVRRGTHNCSLGVEVSRFITLWMGRNRDSRKVLLGVPFSAAYFASADSFPHKICVNHVQGVAMGSEDHAGTETIRSVPYRSGLHTGCMYTDRRGCRGVYPTNG
jgi:hypothetical protein